MNVKETLENIKEALLKKYGRDKTYGLLFFLGALLFLAVIIVIVLISRPTDLGTYGPGVVPQEVRQWQPQMEEELAEYDREEDIHIILAITTQESGGTASPDIMQASESIGLPPNTIEDPEYSIEVGVNYYDQVMTEAENAGVDIDAAIQAYNMGIGYIDFVAENGGQHSEELAQEFSNQMQEELDTNVYGDPNYVDHVKRYMGDFIEP